MGNQKNRLTSTNSTKTPTSHIQILYQLYPFDSPECRECSEIGPGSRQLVDGPLEECSRVVRNLRTIQISPSPTTRKSDTLEKTSSRRPRASHDQVKQLTLHMAADAHSNSVNTVPPICPPVGDSHRGKSRRRTAYPQQIVTTRLLYCLQDPFAQLSRLQRI